jgi:hypothetical protein
MVSPAGMRHVAATVSTPGSSSCAIYLSVTACFSRHTMAHFIPKELSPLVVIYIVI